MAETTRDQSQSRQTPQAAGEPGAKAASTEASTSAFDIGAAGTVGSRRRQYLIGNRPLPGVASVPTELIVQKLQAMEDAEIVRRQRPRPSGALPSGAMQPASEIIVIRVDQQRGEELRRSAAPNIIIEPDGLLRYADTTLPGTMQFQAGQTIPSTSRGKDIALRIVGEGDRPLEGAGVVVFGSGFPAQGVTDASGQTTVRFYDEHNGAANALGGASAIYVRPAADHWERLIPEPALADGVNLVRLRPFNQTFPGFPSQRLVGWGQRMMKLDLLAGRLDGAGVKIGLIDSGCDHTHPLLRHVTQGVEVVDPARPNGWTVDPIGHGTHCAGVIAAGDRSRAQGILGFAPGAELHILKVLPGGRCSDLIAALDECIERQLDVVNIGVASDQISELVALKLAEAREKGVACIVAAGSSGGLAQFPAMSTGALSVSAIGKLGEFPPDTYHAQTELGQPVGAEGLFKPRFSNFAPQISVCAPGVAIVSTVPGGGYAAWDGTSMAAAHVTGFAAVLLAHHPLFQGAYRTRGEHRVAALFETIRASSDPSRAGQALSDLQRAPGWVPPGLQAGQAVAEAGSGRSAFMNAMPQPWQQAALAATSAYLANPVMVQLRAMGMI
jgi:subtilisin